MRHIDNGATDISGSFRCPSLGRPLAGDGVTGNWGLGLAVYGYYTDTGKGAT